jgi:hypothetical protein
MVGDADGDSAVGFEFCPLVGGGVFQVGWGSHVVAPEYMNQRKETDGIMAMEAVSKIPPRAV